jgi:naphthoate synthase
MDCTDCSDNVASMSAARKGDKRATPTKHRDGFELISRQPIHWTKKRDFVDITYHVSYEDACARLAFNRPHILHAFRPQTIRELQVALELATDDPHIGVIVLTSNNTPEYTPAFCAGGDQTVRSNDGGYQDGTEAKPKLRVLDLQVQMRRCPKPILAVVDGYAIGGGHILHMVADLTLASTRSIFGQTGPRMGSFDAGYGSTHAARLLGQKRARELWFLSKFYDAHDGVKMGLINACYPVEELEGRMAQWIRRMVMNSPTALACCKAALNADEDGGAGIQQMGGELTRLFYKSSESQEGRDAFLEKRAPQFRSKL